MSCLSLRRSECGHQCCVRCIPKSHQRAASSLATHTQLQVTHAHVTVVTSPSESFLSLSSLSPSPTLPLVVSVLLGVLAYASFLGVIPLSVSNAHESSGKEGGNSGSGCPRCVLTSPRFSPSFTPTHIHTHSLSHTHTQAHSVGAHSLIVLCPPSSGRGVLAW